MRKFLSSLFGNKKGAKSTAKASNQDAATQSTPTLPPDGMDGLIKMKEAMQLIKASATTVRKYARLGYYSEYRFGEKLVYYDKAEMLNFVINGTYAKR
ncbi:MAG: hypothetical protein SNH67_07455 [Rikenellaceae bacterium]